MSSRWPHRYAALPALVAALLLVCLAGCGGTEQPLVGGNEDEPVGTDWRTYRGYYAGEIREDFQLLYCYYVGDRHLVFYLNTDSQTAVGTADLSGVKSPDFSEENVVFEDLDGDGQDEVRIPMSPLPDLLLQWDDGLSALTLLPGQEESWRFDKKLDCFTKSTLPPEEVPKEDSPWLGSFENDTGTMHITLVNEKGIQFYRESFYYGTLGIQGFADYQDGTAYYDGFAFVLGGDTLTVTKIEGPQEEDNEDYGKSAGTYQRILKASEDFAD